MIENLCFSIIFLLPSKFIKNQELRDILKHFIFSTFCLALWFCLSYAITGSWVFFLILSIFLNFLAISMELLCQRVFPHLLWASAFLALGLLYFRIELIKILWIFCRCLNAIESCTPISSFWSKSESSTHFIHSLENLRKMLLSKNLSWAWAYYAAWFMRYLQLNSHLMWNRWICTFFNTPLSMI